VLPRPVQVVGGLLVAAYSVLTMGCAVVMFNWPDPDHASAIAVMGLVIEAGAIWTFIKAADLLFGRRTQGGLIGATALRVIAIAYSIMMIVGVTMDSIGHSFIGRAVAVVGGLSVIAGLLATARHRAAVKRAEAARQFKA
jgi:hypothetical protein